MSEWCINMHTNQGWKVDRHYLIDETNNPWLWNIHEEVSNKTSMGMLIGPECPKMTIFWVHLDAKRQLKDH